MISVFGVWLKWLIILLGSLILIIILICFIITNPQLIEFELVGYRLTAVKASSAVVISFIVGSLFSLLISLFIITRLKLANSSFKRKLGRRDAEIQKLRANACKGLA